MYKIITFLFLQKSFEVYGNSGIQPQVVKKSALQ